jgi:hypothetical protein
MLRTSEKAMGNSPWIAWIGKSVADMYGLALIVSDSHSSVDVRHAIPMSCAALVVS